AANGAPLVPATPARTVPDVPRARQPAPQTHYRICFVGDERRFAAHAPLVAERATTVFVNCRGALGAKELSQIIAFGPDHTVVFEPERYESARLDAVPGFVIGYSTAPASAATLAALRARFPLSASNARVALHPHVEVVTILREAGIGAAGAFLLPSDWQTLGALVDFATWQKREIDLLYVGAATATNQELLAALREFPGFLHLSEPATDQALCGVLSRTKLALHLPASEDAYFDAAKVIRDLMCGCLVVGHALAADYGLMPGEHYLFFEKPAQLAALVRQQLTLPDELDVIRCRGQQRARLFDAGRDYVAMIERYCCASRLCGATATAPAALEAATTNPPRQ
ncbi:MAG: hypothetical protein KKB50_15890, partial [Planctomycetes bacterium]|nr:hypothetical protein [Planctomycetota bacterium]